MQCPKCGTVQPDAETCAYCHIIISKYRQRQAEQQCGIWPPPSRPVPDAGGGGFPLIKILLLLMIVAGAVGWLWWAQPFAPKAGKYEAQTGVYRNKRFKFELAIPPEWKTYTVKEAITCPTIRKEYADQYFLLTSPTRSEDALLVVDISGVELGYMKEKGWDGMKEMYNSNHPLKYTSEDEVGGIKLYRLGYEIGSSYREDSFFEANGKLIEIYFYVRSGFDSATRIAEMRQVIDSGLKKL